MRLTLRCVLKSVLPPIDGCRGGQSRPPLRGSNGNAFVQRAGRCTPGVLASLRGHRLLRKNRRETVRRGECPHPPVSPSVKTFGFDTSLAEGGKGSSAPAGAGRRIPTGALRREASTLGVRPRNDRLFRQPEHKKRTAIGRFFFWVISFRRRREPCGCGAARRYAPAAAHGWRRR